jgi:sulfur-oxidizing protein SoxX
MKRGEKFILLSFVVLLVFGVVRSEVHVDEKHEKDIPYYSDATPDVATRAMDVYRDNGCKSCHSLWTLKDMTETIPAPILDGLGSLRTEQWFYDYLSSPAPQTILPSRLKVEYRMPSFASIPEADRRVLAKYLASLKVKDWYLEETRKAEYEKLTGLVYKK